MSHLSMPQLSPGQFQLVANKYHVTSSKALLDVGCDVVNSVVAAVELVVCNSFYPCWRLGHFRISFFRKRIIVNIQIVVFDTFTESSKKAAVCTVTMGLKFGRAILQL